MSDINPKYLSLLQAVRPKAFRSDATREDVGESAVISRALDHVEQEIVETMFAALRALRYVPLQEGIDPGAKTYTFTVMTPVGVSRPASGSGKDLPRAEVYLSEHTSNIIGNGAVYGYTTQELREIALASRRGFPLQLDVARADVAVKMIARFIDRTVAFGVPGNDKIRGFCNNPDVTIDPAEVVWADASPEELYSEMLALANRPLIVSMEEMDVDTILLPTDAWTLVSTKQFGLSGNCTVLKFFQEAMAAMDRKVTVASWPILDTADEDGTGPRAISYKRSTKVASSIVPLPFEAQPPQLNGLEWDTACEGRCGGTAVKQPLGLYYRDGLAG